MIRHLSVTAAAVGLFLCAAAARPALVRAPDPDTLWMESFTPLEMNDDRRTGWGNFDPDQISVEIVEGRARLREVGPASVGKLQRYVPFDRRTGSDHRYLQIMTGLIEDVSNAPSVTNASSGGVPMGPLFTGLTTFDLAAQPFAGKAGDFALTIVMAGKAGAEPGGWADICWIRTVRTPTEGLTMDLVENGVPNGTAEVGEKVLFRYRAGGRLEEPALPVSCFIAKNMIPFRFSAEPLRLADDGGNGDEKAGDGIYSRLVSITPDATALTTGPAGFGALIAKVRARGNDSHAPSAFAFDVVTANRTADLVAAATPTARENRQLWLDRTAGRTNLAAGKPVRFSIPPGYSLTNDPNDALDLTDGKLSARGDDRIWFARDAVGWRGGPSGGVNLTLDLGAVEPVGRIVMRVLAGAEQGGLKAPSRVVLAVSEDGKTFREAAVLSKLMVGEKDLDGKNGAFYIPEEGRAYVHPLMFDNLRVRARYVGLQITGDGDFLFIDELAVLKGDFDPKTAAPAGREIPFITDGIAVAPLRETFALSTNIVTPTYLLITDCRAAADRSASVAIVVEVPRAVVLKDDADVWKSVREEMPGGTVRYRIPKSWVRPGGIGPFYFALDPKVPLGPAPKARFSMETKKYEPIVIERPIVPVEIPRVPPLPGIHVSLAWMSSDAQGRRWPDFFAAWKHLGFNAVATFPRYWGASAPPESAEFLRTARTEGMAVIYNESPFHVMVNNHKNEEEIYSVLPGGKKSTAPCPSYRGRFYEEEIKRVGDCFEMSNPGYVFYDVELWYHGAQEAASCLRCQEGLKKAGGKLDDYLADLGTGMVKDMKDEIARRAAKMGRKMPVIGFYDNHATSPVYQSVYEFKKIYPAFVDLSMPSLYCRGDALLVRNTIREEYRLLGKKTAVPWLSTGTYGEFAPEKVEQIVLETLLNGGGGITYYCFDDFDGAMDYYYHAKALAEIAPHTAVVRDGVPHDLVSANPLVTCSALVLKNEMLLLLGNYQSGTTERATVTLPFRSVAAVADLRGEKAPAAAKVLAVDVPARSIRLLHIKGTP